MYFDSLKFKIIRHLLKKALRYNSATRRIWLIYLARIMASHTFARHDMRGGSDLSGPSVTITYSVPVRNDFQSVYFFIERREGTLNKLEQWNKRSF